MDRRDDIFGAAHRIVGVGQIPEVPIGIVGIEPHRLFQKLDRSLRLLGIDQGVGVFGDDVGVVRIERHRVRVFGKRLVVLSAVELGVAELGEAARVEPVELLGAASKDNGRLRANSSGVADQE